MEFTSGVCSKLKKRIHGNYLGPSGWDGMGLLGFFPGSCLAWSWLWVCAVLDILWDTFKGIFMD